MTRQIFNLDSIGWTCRWWYEAGRDCTDAVVSALRAAGAPDRVVQRACTIMDGGVNEGFTFSNTARRESVVFQTPTTDAAEFADTYAHETAHVVAHIAKADGIDPYGESGQYLQGELVHATFPMARRYLCECCRNKSS